ncbi:MAG: hypothetical protein WA728_36060, partial [Xanthobacteraceae bacterium]
SLNHQLRVIILQVRGDMRSQGRVVPAPARRIAANVAKLPELLGKNKKTPPPQYRHVTNQHCIVVENR